MRRKPADNAKVNWLACNNVLHLVIIELPRYYDNFRAVQTAAVHFSGESRNGLNLAFGIGVGRFKGRIALGECEWFHELRLFLFKVSTSISKARTRLMEHR